ncbi:MAG: GHKL domain-containing protein [Chitinophagaceae bacterium]|nr:GHKL domain-containing protein [Chitinophagaceae bacterium]MCB9054481.1 GHKL domain-containing protein [Chitinophagales bacterium]
MKFLFKIFFVFFFPYCLVAQTGTYYDYDSYSQKRVDSLQVLFASTSNDTVKMAVCRDLGLYHIESDLDSSTYFHLLELKIAKELSLDLWIADANELMGYVETKRGNYPAALNYILEAARLGENKKTEKNIWRVTKFSEDGDPEKARLTSLANVYNDWGLLYRSIGNAGKQVEYFSKSIEVGKKINDFIVLSYAYENLGELYGDLGKNDSAQLFLDQSLKYSAAAGFYKYIGSAYIAKGNVFLKQQQYDSARNYFQQAVQISEVQENPAASGYGYHAMARYFGHINQTDSGFYYANKAFRLFTKINEPAGRLLALNTLVTLYKNTSRIDSAFHYQQLAIKVNDSLYNTEKIKQFENIGFDQQLKVQELEKEKVVVQNRNRTIGFIAGTIVFLLIGALLYRNNRQKQKANQVLSKTLNDLRSTQAQLIQSEKMASLGELTAGIAHEIQNPLNFVNNFSDVNNELIEELKAQRSTLNAQEQDELLTDIFQNNEKISMHGKRADAIVKGMLQHSRTSAGEKESTDINALCDEFLRLAYHGLRAKDKSFNAKFETHFEENIDKLNIVPQDIGRVVLNLINNAFYAVNEKQNVKGKTLNAESYEPTVVVSTKKEGGKVVISVKDNGNGIPASVKEKIFQPFFTTKPTGQGTGLGLSLSYDIIKAHGGEVKVESQENVGTCFSFSIPFQTL